MSLQCEPSVRLTELLDNSPGALITVAQVASWLKVDTRTLVRASKKGTMPPYFTLGGGRYFRVQDLREHPLFKE